MDEDTQTQIGQSIAILDVLNPSKIPAPIPLNLSYWSKIRPADAARNDVSQVKELLQFFLTVAVQNNLDNTTAALKVADAIKVMDRVTPTINTASIRSKDRMSFQQSSLSQPKSVQHLQLRVSDDADLHEAYLKLAQYIVEGVPIFNIWDSISMIRTLCVEPIYDEVRAELHLYQVRTLLRIFSKHWYLNGISPTTAAATWSRSGTRPFTIAFVTTCSGDPNEKRIMATARFTFANEVIAVVRTEFAMRNTPTTEI